MHVADGEMNTSSKRYCKICHTNSIGEVLKHKKLGKGEWIIVETKMSGGGYAHNDYYSDAHTLVLRPILPAIAGISVIENKGKPKIFYQNTGSFSDDVILPYIKPTRKVQVLLFAEDIENNNENNS